jgi:hypothetical protein
MAGDNQAKITVSLEDRTKAAFEAVNARLEALGKATETPIGGLGRLKASAAALDKVLGAVGISLTGLIGVASVAGFAELIKGAIDSEAHLARLAKTAGVSVEALGGLRGAAKYSETSLEEVAGGLQKISRSIAEALGDPTSKAASAFEAIGIDVKTLKGLAPDQVVLKVAKALEKYGDGVGKNAVVQALFNKTGAEFLPFLSELAERGLSVAKVTDEQAAKAKEFNDNLITLRSGAEALRLTLANELLPTLNDIVKAMIDAKEQSGGLAAFTRGIGEVFKVIVVLGANVGYVFTQMGVEISGIAQQLNALAHLDFKTFGILRDEMVKQAAEARKAIDDFSDRVLNGPKRAAATAAKGDKPQIDPAAVGRDKAKDANLASKRLALVRAQAEAEFALLKSQLDEALKEYDFALEQNLISVRQHAQARLEIVSRELDAETAAKRRELAEAQKTAANKDDPAKALEARVHVKRLEGEIAVIQQRRIAASDEATRAEIKGEKALADELRGVREELDGILHNLSPEARRAAIAAQLQPTLDKFRAAGNKEGEQAVIKLIDVRATNAELQEVDRQASILFDSLAEREQTVQTQIAAGLLTEIEGRRIVVALHKETAAKLDELAPKYERITTALDTPEARLALDRLNNRIAQLKVVVDEVAKAIDDSLKNSLGALLNDVVTKAKTGSQAMHDFAQSVIQSFASIITKRLGEQLFDSLFGKESGLGAFGSWIAGLGSGKAEGGAIAKAEGGPISGPGTATSDSIPALGPGGALYALSDGEFVQRAAAVRHYGRNFMEAVNGLRLRVDRGFAFAAGGAVTAAPMASQRAAAAPPPVLLQIHPDALHMTLQDWFERELARTAARR